MKQQVIATATVYFKRFYARNSIKCIDPLLLAPTCILLASKVEEFGVISNNRLHTTCLSIGWSAFRQQLYPIPDTIELYFMAFSWTSQIISFSGNSYSNYFCYIMNCRNEKSLANLLCANIQKLIVWFFLRLQWRQNLITPTLRNFPTGSTTSSSVSSTCWRTWTVAWLSISPTGKTFT